MKKRIVLFIVSTLLFFGIQASAVLASDNSQYNPIIEKYIQAINEKWDASQLTNNNMYFDMGFNYGDTTNLNNYGYAFYDLNNDGSDELLIGPTGALTSYNSSYIFDAYTLIGSTPISFVKAWDRNTFRLTSDNYLFNHGSGGATYYADIFWKFNGNDLELEYAVQRDGDTFYYSSVNSTPSEGEHLIISYDEFQALTQVVFKNINYTPFSAFDENQANAPVSGGSEYSGKAQPIFRLYNLSSHEHLYTSDSNEAATLARQKDWNNEGISWYAPLNGEAVYRLYSPVTGSHLFTKDANEVSTLSKNGWSVDNSGNPLFYSGGSKPIYRLYSQALRMHLLTTDSNEYNSLGSQDWDPEGVALNGLSDSELNS